MEIDLADDKCQAFTLAYGSRFCYVFRSLKLKFAWQRLLLLCLGMQTDALFDGCFVIFDRLCGKKLEISFKPRRLQHSVSLGKTRPISGSEAVGAVHHTLGCVRLHDFHSAPYTRD